MAIKWSLSYKTQKNSAFSNYKFYNFFYMRFFVVSLCTDMLCLSPVYHWLLASLGRRHRCSDFQYFSLTAKVCFSFEKISSVTWYLLIIQRCAWFALWILDACYPTLFILRCYVFCFSDRLIEIAGNRFPTYFDSEEKLFCMTRSIHLYRELTCDSVLKRYSFPEFKKKKKDDFDWIVYNSICLISKFCEE